MRSSRKPPTSGVRELVIGEPCEKCFARPISGGEVFIIRPDEEDTSVGRFAIHVHEKGGLVQAEKEGLLSMSADQDKDINEFSHMLISSEHEHLAPVFYKVIHEKEEDFGFVYKCEIENQNISVVFDAFVHRRGGLEPEVCMRFYVGCRGFYA
jgi:hypothetical protein